MVCAEVPENTEVLELFVSPCFPGVAKQRGNSGKSIICYYLNVSLTSTNPSSENTEQQTTKAFRGFWQLSVNHENDGISRRLGNHRLSVFSNNVMDWNEIWKSIIWYYCQCIIDFPGFTVSHVKPRLPWNLETQ